MKNIAVLIAGLLTLGIGFLHLIGGQLDHADPMLASNLIDLDKAVLLGAWHMVTAVLFLSAVPLISFGMNVQEGKVELVKWLGILNLAFAVAFILVSVFRGVFTPQWILFLPVGILVLFGVRKSSKASAI